MPDETKPYIKVRLETEGGVFVHNTFVLPFLQHPDVILWGSRVFAHYEENTYRECFYATAMPDDYIKKAFGLTDEDFIK